MAREPPSGYSQRVRKVTEAHKCLDFRSRSRKVVESFVQSVVVLDDFAYFGEQGEQPDGQLTAPTLDDASLSLVTRSQGGSPVGENRIAKDVRLDAKTVIGRFAELGSVCAVLNPAPEEEFLQKVAKAAARADIVILDWKIGDFYGDKTLEVVRHILDDDQDGGRLRLLAIYTGEPDLEDMAKRTGEIIDNYYTNEKLAIDSHGLRISKGPVHAVILAKEGTNRITQAHQGQVVEESQLPDRLIDEFTRVTEGLLGNVALAGLTALRAEAHKLLLKFAPSLDAAYLGHRLLLPNPQDAEDHVVDALGAELHSILEDARPGEQADISAGREWLVAKTAEGKLDLSSPVIFPNEANLLGRYSELLLEGSHPDKKKLERNETTEIFTTDGCEAIQSNHRFSTLLKLKSRYSGSGAPRLTLGTILSTGDGEDARYFLCVQPKCDSVRIKSEAGFPFLPLIIQKHNQRFDVVFDVGADKWKYLKLNRKPNALIVPSFKPTPHSGGEVLARFGADGNYFFNDTAQVKYRWVVEMKDEHGLKIASELAAALSRPGPNDAEWLRRASTR